MASPTTLIIFPYKWTNRDFLKDNKTSATKVVVNETAPKLEKREKLGKMPDYLVKRRLKEKFVLDKEEKEEKILKRKAKAKKSLDDKRKMELLTALKKRRDDVLMKMETSRSENKKRLMDIEVKALDLDINKLEAIDLLFIVP